MSPSRSVLLVGEGNFSFSASMSQTHADTETSITATCLQHQDEALRHEGAATNVQTITDSGTVHVFVATLFNICSLLRFPYYYFFLLGI